MGQSLLLLRDNGIRWSANNLIEISNTAITEAVRLINQYSDSNLMKSLGKGFFEASSVVAMNSGSGTISSYILDVLSVTEVPYADGTESRPYTYIEPDKYNEIFGSKNKPYSDMYIYTVRTNLSLGARRLYARGGNAPVNGSLLVMGIYNKSDYGTGNNNDEIFLYGLDDFLLDVAERECRDREHNWDRSQILDARIALKLGMQRSQNG